jgi:uncharacterized protein (TIGR02147 family)
MEQVYFQQYLKEEFLQRINRNERYSLRAFSRSLNMDIATLSEVMSGKRLLSFKKAEAIVTILDLQGKMREHFLLSVALLHKDKKSRLNPKFKELLSSNTSTEQSVQLELNNFAVISEWYHFAIIELTSLKNFKYDVAWISKKLNLENSVVRDGIDRLIELGYLIEKNGKLKKAHKLLVTTDRHTTNSALKKRQSQILYKSIHSLNNDPIEIRNHTAMTLAIDSDLIPEAKKRINDFMLELTSFLESKKQTRVYEFTINLFPLDKQLEEE